MVFFDQFGVEVAQQPLYKKPYGPYDVDLGEAVQPDVKSVVVGDEN